MIQKHIPQKLPKCNYPKAADIKLHGLFQLPKDLVAINWQEIKKYRSREYSTISLEQLTNAQILQMAHIVACSFAKNEPMKRHLQPPKNIPLAIIDTLHIDPFGKEIFGEWTSENLVYWFIRLVILTNPADAIDDIGINREMRKISVAILDKDSKIIGGAFNTIASSQEEALRKFDPFLEAVLSSDKPIFDLIFSQEHDAIEALKKKYPDFQNSLESKRVGLHFMVARSPDLPTVDTFELVAASAETLKNQGFKYMITCASNQWTGAACKVLNGTQVHFIPYRTKERVAKEANALENEPYSIDGFISDKDSGAMFYIIKLA